MKTIKLNVFAEQRKWIEQHRHADSIVCNAQGEPVQAIYTSPLERWRGMMKPDGTVNVPDMEYYNSLTSASSISDAINELFPPS